MLPIGKYHGKPIEAVLGYTGGGSEQIAVTFELIDPPGQVIVWYGYFSDKTWERTIESLRACGWVGTDFEEFCYGQPLPLGFDKTVELVIDHEPDQNNVLRAKVRWVNSVRGPAVKRVLDSNQARQFAARMRGNIIAWDRANETPQGPPAGNPPAPELSESVSDDEIPF